MRIVYFTHSLLSCWNHGNAHFLRGLLRELQERGHEVIALEPQGNWSLSNLLADHGYAGLEPFANAYPDLKTRSYRPNAAPEDLIGDADLVMVDGLIRLMDSELDLYEPVNLGNPFEVTINDLLDLVIEITGTKARAVYRPLPVDDPRRRKPDIGRAEQLLGWRPEVGLRQGLVATCDWFAQEIEKPWKRSERTASPPIAPISKRNRASSKISSTRF